MAKIPAHKTIVFAKNVLILPSNIIAGGGCAVLAYYLGKSSTFYENNVVTDKQIPEPAPREASDSIKTSQAKKNAESIVKMPIEKAEWFWSYFVKPFFKDQNKLNLVL